MSAYKTKAIVLRTYKLGEADRIIVLASKDNGKIRTVAKGIRKTTSRISGRLEPLSEVSLQLWKGKGDLQTINQVETINSFRCVKTDLERLNTGLAMAEAIDQLLQDENPQEDMYTMFSKALQWLDNKTHDPSLVLAGFYLKLLTLEGTSPTATSCSICNLGYNEVDLTYFDYKKGGTICSGCYEGEPISQNAVTAIRAMLNGGLGKILSISPHPCSREIEHFATISMETHLDRRLKSMRTGKIYLSTTS